MKLVFTTMEILSALDRVLQERGFTATDATDIQVPGLPPDIEFEIVMTNVDMIAPPKKRETVVAAPTPTTIKKPIPPVPQNVPVELVHQVNKFDNKSKPVDVGPNRTGETRGRSLTELLNDPEDFSDEIGD